MTITSGLGCANTVDGNSIHFIFVENSLSHWSLKSPTAGWYVYIQSCIYIYICSCVFLLWMAGKTNRPGNHIIHPSHPPRWASRLRRLFRTTDQGQNRWQQPQAMSTSNDHHQEEHLRKASRFLLRKTLWRFLILGMLVGWMKRWTLQFTYNPFQNLTAMDHKQKWWVSPVGFSQGSIFRCHIRFERCSCILVVDLKIWTRDFVYDSETLDMSWPSGLLGVFVFQLLLEFCTPMIHDIPNKLDSKGFSLFKSLWRRKSCTQKFVPPFFGWSSILWTHEIPRITMFDQ